MSAWEALKRWFTDVDVDKWPKPGGYATGGNLPGKDSNAFARSESEQPDRYIISPGQVVRSREHAEQLGLGTAWDMAHGKKEQTPEPITVPEPMTIGRLARETPIPHVGGELRGLELITSPDGGSAVVSKEAVKAFGRKTLDRINQLPKDKGDRPVPALPGFGSSEPKGPTPEHSKRAQEAIQEVIEAAQEARGGSAAQRWAEAPLNPGEVRVHDLEGSEWRVWAEGGMIMLAGVEGTVQVQFDAERGNELISGFSHAVVECWDYRADKAAGQRTKD